MPVDDSFVLLLQTTKKTDTCCTQIDLSKHTKELRLYGPVTETFLLTLSSIFTCFWNAGTTVPVSNVTDFWRNILYGCSCRSLGWTDQCNTPTNCQNLNASYIIIIHMLLQKMCIHSHKFICVIIIIAAFFQNDHTHLRWRHVYDYVFCLRPTVQNVK